MATVNKIAVKIDAANKRLTEKIRSHVFDVIAVGLVLAVGLLNLGAVELRDIKHEIWDILLEAVPFYLGSIALALNFYKKGVYAGKATEGFKNIVKFYSDVVNKLSGKQIEALNDFCSDYNAKALRLKQENILRDVAITFERFNEYTIGEDGKKLKPLKIMRKSELKSIYGKTVCNAVIAAKNVKIRGLNANNILGNTNCDDITDIGKTEQEMLKDRSKEYSILYAVSIVVMSMMGVKDILEWGWMGAFLMTFKMIYILCRSYMKYFEGYDDMTVRLTNHVSRKTDILKQYESWYDRLGKEKEAAAPKIDVQLSLDNLL